MKLSSAILSLAVAGYANGFQSYVGPSTQQRSSINKMARHMVPPEESAKAMSDYMAKAHEAKLKAIKDVEEKKAAEIQALRDEVETLKRGAAASSSAIAPAAPAAAGALVYEDSVEELTAKLISYQNFMAKYIVEAQEQKLLAVKSAEAAAAKTYDAKLLLLGAAAAAAPPSDLEVPVSKEQKAYMDRSAKVTDAGKAGKSRWGDAEVKRSSKDNVNVNVGSKIVDPPAAAASTGTVVNVPPEVEAADHGLRANGEVGGLTLAERVAQGAQSDGSDAVAADSAASVPILSKTHEVYNKRNGLIAAAGKKSRWGEMEVAKASATAPAVKAAPAAKPVVSSKKDNVNIGAKIVASQNTAVPATATINAVPTAPSAQDEVPSCIKEADHGLRNEGSVGGLTLAERVAQGAQSKGAEVVAPADSTAVGAALSATRVVYNKRNGLIAAAGKKSRWGEMEVARASALLEEPPSALLEEPPSALAEEPPQAATMSQRVNIGAELFSPWSR